MVHDQSGGEKPLLLQVGLNLAGGSSLLPYTNTTKQILVAAFRKSVNDNGQVQLLSVQVSIGALVYLLLHQSWQNTPSWPVCIPPTGQPTLLL